MTELSSKYGVPKSTIATWTKNLSPIKVSEESNFLKEYKALQKKMKDLEIREKHLLRGPGSCIFKQEARVPEIRTRGKTML